ncbi:MAG: hypothetical protein ACR2MB_07140 [Acidimicrobiales bacterium]
MPDQGDSDEEPPENIHLEFDVALGFLAVLEDASEVLIDTGHLALVMEVETVMRQLTRKLGFGDTSGGLDD